MRLLLAMVIGCAGEPGDTCKADEDVRASFSLSPQPPGTGWRWTDKPCTVETISGDAHTLVCEDIADVAGTDTLTLTVKVQPERELLIAGEVVAFSYFERNGFASVGEYFSLKRSGALALAGQRTTELTYPFELPSTLYAPHTVDLSTSCDVEETDCLLETRLGLSFDGSTVFDHQHRITDRAAIWVESARSHENKGVCTDQVRGLYDFIVAAP
jgi:hypothetical protein